MRKVPIELTSIAAIRMVRYSSSDDTSKIKDAWLTRTYYLFSCNTHFRI